MGLTSEKPLARTPVTNIRIGLHEGASRGSGGFWRGTGPRYGAPLTPGPLPTLPRRIVGELPPAGRSDGLGGGLRATGDHFSLPHTEVRLKPRRLPLCDAGLGSGRPSRRGPFLIEGTFDSLLDSTFEAMSGFTTTGSTLLSDIEAQTPSILFWRSMTQ
jgi:hypothetical protein